MTENTHPATPATDSGGDETQTAASGSALPSHYFGAPCPIEIGEEVRHCQNEALRGRVVFQYADNGVAMCSVVVPGHPHSVALPPWFLRPVSGETPGFATQMTALVTAQRAIATQTLEYRQQEALTCARTLAAQLSTVADDLAGGKPPSVEPEFWLANDLEHHLADLRELRELLDTAGLLTCTKPTETIPAAD